MDTRQPISWGLLCQSVYFRRVGGVNGRGSISPFGGMSSRRRRKDYVRFLFEKRYGIPVKGQSRKKLDRIRNMTRHLQAYGLGGTEVRINGARDNVE